MKELNIELLSGAVEGEVLTAGDENYDEARKVWNARFDRRPAAIVRCLTAEDVRTAVNFARNKQMLLSVKSGGHAYAANTVGEGSLLIDLSPLKGIKINPEKRTARVEPGVTWGELDKVTQEYGLATTGGTVSTIGIAGFTLGGGSGYLARKHGMGIDNLLSVEIVTAAGQIVRASAAENADLYWALRGGGGNFGVATLFEFQLHEVGQQVLAGQIMHHFKDTNRLLPAYDEFMRSAPEEIQCYAFILRVPPIDDFPESLHGQLALDFVIFHMDPAGINDLLPLIELGDPFLSVVGPQSYTDVQKTFDAGLPGGFRYESRSHYLTGLPDEAIESIIDHAPGLVGEFSVAYLDPLGGAFSRIDPEATAFPHRDPAYTFHILAGWMDRKQDDEVRSWAKDFHEAMKPFSTGGVYVNLLGTDEQERVRAAYGRNYPRLVELKKKWDPENLFKMNHNISPG